MRIRTQTWLAGVLVVAASLGGGVVRAHALSGIIDTYVGGGNGDGSAAQGAIIDPRGFIAVGSESAPDFYIADSLNNRVRRVDGNTGLIETIAGNGERGFSGDGGSAVNAKLASPLDVARDSAGNVYIADTQNNRIRKVTPSGQISTFAGTGVLAYSGDGGLATQAALYNPQGVAVGPDGYVYIADNGNNRIRSVGPPGCGPSTCVITTVVGTGTGGFSGDGGPANLAMIRNPADVAFDGAGTMLIADFSNHRIRKVVNGVILTIAGGGTGLNGAIGDGGPALTAVLRYPTQVAADNAGNVYIADSQNRRIRVVQAATQFIVTAAGTGTSGTTGDGGPAENASIQNPFGVAAIGKTMWLSQTVAQQSSRQNRVRRVLDGVITSVVGGDLGDGAPAYDALVDPRGADAKAGDGAVPDLYFADSSDNLVRFVDGATATMQIIGGTGAAGYSGDGGPATAAQLRAPSDVAVDNDGNVYVADTANHAVRRIDPEGRITTVAGKGTRGASGDGGPATSALLASPTGVAIDDFGRLFIADMENNRIRVVIGGVIETFAGTGESNYGGDGGAAAAAKLRFPNDVAVAKDGTVYISDTLSNRIRRVDARGIITTYAGVGTAGYNGDDIAATSARLNSPLQIAVDDTGNLFIADSRNLRIRMVDPASGVISTVAGNGQSGDTGDGGSATAASFSDPSGIAVDPLTRALFINSKPDTRVRIVEFSGASPPQPTATPTATFAPPTATPTFTSIPPTATRTPTNTAPAPTNTAPAPTNTPPRTNTPGSSTASVAGVVKYYANSQMVSSVDVAVTGSANMTVRTNGQGSYAATGPDGTWALEPRKTGAFGNAVSSLDAARVLQAIVGKTQLSPMQRLACDVTGDGTLSSFDAVHILQLSAGVIKRFPAATNCGSDWLFYPSPVTIAGQQIVEPSLTGGTCRQGEIVLSALNDFVQRQDFDAILFGDCTGNWTPTSGALRQTAGNPNVKAGPPRYARGNRVLIPIFVTGTQEFDALDLAISFNTAEGEFIDARLRNDPGDALLNVTREQGQITISIASGSPIPVSGGPVLLLAFTADGDADLGFNLDGASVDEQLAR
ncbi:MAG: dockerin type I domain-containing protein [Candidatus Binatia bacterium]